MELGNLVFAGLVLSQAFAKGYHDYTFPFNTSWSDIDGFMGFSLYHGCDGVLH